MIRFTSHRSEEEMMSDISMPTDLKRVYTDLMSLLSYILSSDMSDISISSLLLLLQLGAASESGEELSEVST